MPQAPQLLLSLVRSRQTPEQFESPLLHDTAHTPDEHTCPAMQALPQRPQFCRSVWMFWQAPEQLVKPVAHETAQLPEEHT